MPTIFECIVAGEIPCHKVWEDDHFLAFLDIHPRVIGHTLVIPKVATDDLFDLESGDYHALWDAVAQVSAKLKRVLGCQRVCLGVYGFEVPHVHVHLFPANTLAEVPIPPESAQALAMLKETAAKLAPQQA